MRKWVFLFVAIAMMISLATFGIGCKGKEAEKPAPKVEKPAEAPAPAPAAPAGTAAPAPAAPEATKK